MLLEGSLYNKAIVIPTAADVPTEKSSLDQNVTVAFSSEEDVDELVVVEDATLTESDAFITDGWGRILTKATLASFFAPGHRYTMAIVLLDPGTRPQVVSLTYLRG